MGNRYELIKWHFPGSAYASGIKFTRLEGNVAVVSLHQLLEFGCENPLDSASLYDVPGCCGPSLIELNFPLKYLGKHQSAISALERIMESVIKSYDIHNDFLWRAL